MRPAAEDKKHDKHRHEGGEHVDWVTEHVRGDASDHQIPDHSPAYGGDNAKDDDPEQV